MGAPRLRVFASANIYDMKGGRVFALLHLFRSL